MVPLADLQEQHVRQLHNAVLPNTSDPVSLNPVQPQMHRRHLPDEALASFCELCRITLAGHHDVILAWRASITNTVYSFAATKGSQLPPLHADLFQRHVGMHPGVKYTHNLTKRIICAGHWARL